MSQSCKSLSKLTDELEIKANPQWGSAGLTASSAWCNHSDSFVYMRYYFTCTWRKVCVLFRAWNHKQTRSVERGATLRKSYSRGGAQFIRVLCVEPTWKGWGCLFLVNSCEVRCRENKTTPIFFFSRINYIFFYFSFNLSSPWKRLK